MEAIRTNPVARCCRCHGRLPVHEAGSPVALCLLCGAENRPMPHNTHGQAGHCGRARPIRAEDEWIRDRIRLDRPFWPQQDRTQEEP